MGKFELYKGKDEQFYFRLKAANGQNIGASEGYKEKSSAQNGIESVKKNAPDADRYELSETKNGQWHFNLKARNGQAILSSQTYADQGGAQNGIESVKKNAPDADIQDDTQAA